RVGAVAGGASAAPPWRRRLGARLPRPVRARASPRSRAAAGPRQEALDEEARAVRDELLELDRLVERAGDGDADAVHEGHEEARARLGVEVRAELAAGDALAE